jgi:hypothetical protein
MVIIDEEDGYHVDPMGTEPYLTMAKPAISTLVAILRQVGYHPQVVVTHFPLERARQTDGRNCGVFVCAYAWALANDHPLDFDPANIEDFRMEIFGVLAQNMTPPLGMVPTAMGPQSVDYFCRFRGPMEEKETDVVVGTGQRLGLARRAADIRQATPGAPPCLMVDDQGKLITINHHDNIFNFRTFPEIFRACNRSWDEFANRFTGDAALRNRSRYTHHVPFFRFDYGAKDNIIKVDRLLRDTWAVPAEVLAVKLF